MYQSFSFCDTRPLLSQRVTALREKMALEGIDGYLIPHEDEFQGEYVPACAMRLEWISGFSGSAGLVLVTLNEAFLFVDGRYTTQAPTQTDTAIFTVVSTAEMSVSEWMKEHLPNSIKTLAYDPQLFTVACLHKWQGILTPKEVTLQSVVHNLLDSIWKDRPAFPETNVFEFPLEIAGLTVAQKIAFVTEQMVEKNADYLILTNPESLCWLLNVRASDVPHTPLVLSYGIVTQQGIVSWFVGKERINHTLQDRLGDTVIVCSREAFLEDCADLVRQGKTVWIDPNQISGATRTALETALCVILEAEDPCELLKACKTPSEIKAIKQAHLYDGTALCRFLAWLDHEIQGDRFPTEIETVTMLETFRHNTGHLKDISFDTISGSGAHGAIVHYRVTHDTDRHLEAGEFFLLDSGGQYLEGTTDVTRTVAIGTPTSEMKDRFTRVLKGHIALASLRWPYKEGKNGLTGAHFDAFARHALWQGGLDYNHGTGHGVGCFLSVHEGPQSISLRSQVPLQAGMVLSNEPGYYKVGAYGIRIESLILVHEAKKRSPDEDHPMMSFETLTLAPIDLRAVDETLLTHEEKAWLNAYHAHVFQTIFPHLSTESERTWLRQATKEIG